MKDIAEEWSEGGDGVGQQRVLTLPNIGARYLLTAFTNTAV